MKEKVLVSQNPFHSLEVSRALELTNSSTSGLTSEAANQRLKIFGANTLVQKRKLTKTRIFLRQFTNPLIFILLIAGGITLILEHYTDALFVISAALANAGLGYYQENKAEEALEHLKTYIKQRIRVYRDNLRIEIDATNLVPGDIIYISQGDRIPADARIITTNDLQVDEAVLTGESLPVTKSNKPVKEVSPLAERLCMLHSGTVAVQGFATALVVKTGDDTEIGKIAQLVKEGKQQLTPLQASLKNFTLRAAVFLITLTIGVFFIAITSGMPLLEAFLLSVVILVSAVPEGLPIVMTVILAIGVQRLVKKNAIVRKLAAAETLGSTTVILTDKTGTLTQAKMELSSITNYYEPAHLKEQEHKHTFMLQIANLNIDTVVENPDDPVDSWRVTGKPVEVAVRIALGNATIPEVENEAYLPFNSVNKYSASINQISEKFLTGSGTKHKRVLTILGAPEIILNFSRLSDERKKEIMEEISKAAHQGDRLVGIGLKEVHENANVNLKDPEVYKGLEFLGTVSLRDPVRPGTKEALDRVQKAGVRVVIITGDHAGTATAVARELGLHITKENLLTGSEIEKLTNKQLQNILPKIKIISRVSPEGKLKVAQAFQDIGAVIAMNGDGVNDAPAIKRADIGIAMGSGTDVSKDVADLVLLDNNFQTIVYAIEEGRRISNNIRKAITYLATAVLDAIFLIGGALILGIPLPFNALQILWVNLFTDSFPGIALAFEKNIDGVGSRPINLRKGLFTKAMKFIVLLNGTLSSILLIGVYVYLLKQGYEVELVKTFIYATFGTYSLLLIFAVRSLQKSMFSINPFSNPYIISSVGIGIVLVMLSVYMPPLQKLFNTTALPFNWMISVFIFGIVNILLIEVSKWFAREKNYGYLQ